LPIESPVGFLTTLEEAVATARRASGPLESHWKTPVLLVVAPMEDWVEITAVRTAVDPRGSSVTVQMMPTLVFRVEHRDPKAAAVTFGRSVDCDVVMPFAAMSKRHGVLFEREGEWHVSDVGSKNGTFVEGKKLAKDAPQVIRDGATLRFGDVTARFLLPHTFCHDLRRRQSAGH